MRRLTILLALMAAWGQDRRVTPLGVGRRVALVVGNNAYSWGKLDQAVADARAIKVLLQQLGFQPANIY